MVRAPEGVPAEVPRANLKVLTPQEADAALQSVARTHPILALYSSLHGGLIMDPRRMCLPFGDHMVHRGHAIFDTGTVINGRLYRLRSHLERFFRSAALARIKPPFSLEESLDIIAETCAVTNKRDLLVRYWLSSGGVDLNITPGPDSVPHFWVAAFEHPAVMLQGSDLVGVSESTVPASVVPLKPDFFAKAKTTNYFLNCLASLEAKAHGGFLGIWLDADGYLAECSIAACICVDQNGVVIAPRLDAILESITAARLRDALFQRIPALCTCEAGIHSAAETPKVDESASIPAELALPLPDGIKKFRCCARVTKDDLANASEIISLSGEVLLLPIVQLDGKPIGDGKVGPFAKWFKDQTLHEARFGHAYISREVPYHLHHKEQ